MLTVLDDVPVLEGQHVVQLYAHEDALALTVGRFLGAALVADEIVLVVATAEHRLRFEAELEAAGVDVAAAQLSGRYHSRDAAQLLAGLLLHGTPDQARFDASVGALVAELTSGGRPVRIYGEMVALLWDKGAVTEAIELEQLWNALARRMPFTLFCAYPQAAATAPAICEHHDGVVPEPRLPDPTPGRALRLFEPTLRAAPVARHFLTSTLREWGLHRLLESAEVVGSELIGNAIRHGRQRFTVELLRRGDAVRISVTDRSPALPVTRECDPRTATGGRGMHLIAALSRRWGTERREPGKTVWAEISR